MPASPNQAEPITAQNYHARAIACAEATGGHLFPTLKLASPEYIAWGRYFRDHLRWLPWAYKRLEHDEGKEMTVPTQWPEWFDSSFSSVNSISTPKRPALSLVEKERE